MGAAEKSSPQRTPDEHGVKTGQQEGHSLAWPRLNRTHATD